MRRSPMSVLLAGPIGQRSWRAQGPDHRAGFSISSSVSMARSYPMLGVGIGGISPQQDYPLEDVQPVQREQAQRDPGLFADLEVQGRGEAEIDPLGSSR